MCEGHEHSHKGVTVWLTGLPCSGKSGVAEWVGEVLKDRGYGVELLDGDAVRKELTRDLGYSKEDRDENIRRVTFVAKLLTRHGVIVLTSFVSPYRAMRERARREIGEFLEVYVKCPIEVCVKRDVKGMYKKARAGEIPAFTGVSDPYEEPERPDLVLETDKEPLEQSAGRVLALLKERGYLE